MSDKFPPKNSGFRLETLRLAAPSVPVVEAPEGVVTHQQGCPADALDGMRSTGRCICRAVPVMLTEAQMVTLRELERAFPVLSDDTQVSYERWAVDCLLDLLATLVPYRPEDTKGAE